MKYWILIILFVMFTTIMLCAEIPDYDEMIEKLENSKDDSLKYEVIKEDLCFYYPESEKVYEFANEEYYDKMYPIWRNDSLKVIEINKLLEKYPKTNWRRTMYQSLCYSLYDMGKRDKLKSTLINFRNEFPDDYIAFYISARYLTKINTD
ncbi:MAG: hypothetical protein HOD64_11410, partial [Candidatus Cloacimonetes bacterium]|nr:hypothetical protein [Candidatus Cloacimonadota bacterium]